MYHTWREVLKADTARNEETQAATGGHVQASNPPAGEGPKVVGSPQASR
jgi:hypothetical protein